MKKFLLYTLGGIVLLVLVANLVAYIFLDSIVKSELEKALVPYTDSISIGRVHIRPHTYSVKISDIWLETSTFASKKRTKINLQTEGLSIGLKSLRQLLEKKLNLRHIKISNGKLSLVEQPYDTLIETRAKPDTSLLDIKLNELELKDIAFNYEQEDGGFSAQSSVNITLKGLELKKDSNLRYNFSSVSLELNKNNIQLKKQRQEIHAKKFSFDGKNLTIKDLAWNPTESKQEFYERHNYAKDFIKIKTKNISLSDISYKLQRLQDGLQAKKLAIDGFDLDVYKNLAYRKRFRSKKFPIELLKKIKIPFRIEQLSLKNSRIKYGQAKSWDDKLAYIDFRDIRVESSPVFNSDFQKKDSLIVTWKSKMYGKISLDARLAFSYTSKHQAFSLKGKLGSGRLSAFNPMVVPAANINIREGQCKPSHFYISATKHNAKGWFDLEYDNLKIGLIGKESKQELKSFLGWGSRTLISSVIHKRNLKSGRRFRRGEILYRRSYYNSFPNYLWASVRTGLFDAVSRVGKKKKPFSNLKKKRK